MIGVRVVVVAALGLAVGSPSLFAQTPFQYRGYALESSVASVVQISGARESETRLLHQRPAKIQELEWRVPYGRSGSESADPVRDVRFSFYNDRLYQVVVTYHRDRTEGLTNEDVIESMTAIYGPPLLSSSRTDRSPLPVDVSSDSTVVARWEDDASLLILTRGTYPPQYQLVLTSKKLNADARKAIKEAVRLDAQEAPQRELDQRKKDTADALAAGQKARVVNKPAFRP